MDIKLRTCIPPEIITRWLSIDAKKYDVSIRGFRVKKIWWNILFDEWEYSFKLDTFSREFIEEWYGN